MEPEESNAPESGAARARAIALAVVLVLGDAWLSSRYGLGVRVLAALAVVGLERLLTRRVLRLSWGKLHVSLGNALGTTLLCGGLVLVAAFGFAAFHGVSGHEFEHTPQNVREVSGFWPYVAFACLLVPLAEELIYRGLIQVELASAFGPWRAVFLMGPIFWTYHWWAWGGVTAVNQLFAGWILAWSFQRTRSLLAPTILHAAGNLLVALIDLLLLTQPEFMRSVFGVH